jgi:endonuclease YncB( thermonuclease family)
LYSLWEVEKGSAGMIYGPYVGIVRDWHDGDTCYVDLDLGFSMFAMAKDFDGHSILKCRIYGINAPELNTTEGVDAHLYAMKLCPPGTRVLVVSHGWDNYGGRFDGQLTLPGGSDFAMHMLEAGMAKKYGL